MNGGRGEEMTTWVYLKTEPRLWTVGFFAPDGSWHTDSDHGSKEDAAQRVILLNGGCAPGARLEAEARDAAELEGIGL